MRVETPSVPPISPAPGRLLSLDIARGLTMAFMVVVNNNGAAPYPPFKHSSWNGWTLTDLVFPSFLFFVGTSVVLSLGKRLDMGASRRKILLGVLRRTVLLIVFGLVVNGFPRFDLVHLRLYGVLQRIALCYLGAALLYVWRRSAVAQASVLLALLLGYAILMRYVPVPGAGMPTRDIPLLDPDQNWVAWLDRKLLPGRLYEGVRDPEGLLSTLPSLATTLLGVLAGVWLRSERTRLQISKGLAAAGVVLVVSGQLWDVVLPINKKLWTSSYVLFAGGCTLLLLALLYWCIDVKRWHEAWEQPWIVFGTNAIFAYMFSELLALVLWNVRVGGTETLWKWIYDRSFAIIQPSGVGSLVYSLVYTGVCWLATYALWKRRIFLRV